MGLPVGRLDPSEGGHERSGRRPSSTEAARHRARRNEARSSRSFPGLIDSTRLTGDPSAVRENLLTSGVICLLGVALIHLLELPEHTADAPYIAVLFGLLSLSNLALAILLTRRVMLHIMWPAVGVLALVGIVSYTYSRTIGLPQIEDHVGEWGDLLGTASLVFEALLVALSVPRLRLRALRLAPAMTLVTAGLIISAGLTGGASGHGHGAGAEQGHAGDSGRHAHVGGGEAGHGHTGMNVDTATPQQQAWGRAHLREALLAAKQRFPTLEAARTAGYQFRPRPHAAQKNLTWWHLTNPGTDDRDYINPQRPESLMYWNNPRGKPMLVAFIYRVPRKDPNQPQEPGPLFSWHVHASRGGLAKRKMVHLWLLDDIREAFSPEIPLRQLARKYGTPENGGPGAGVD